MPDESPAQTLPRGWRVLRFDQFTENIAERVDPAEANAEHYVGLEHLDPESLTIRRWGSPTDVIGEKLRFRAGDVIYGRRRAYQRKLAVPDFDGICSAHAMVLRAREGVMLQRFLPFFMQSETFHQRALQISVGSLSPTINWRTLAAQEFAIPPLDEQRRIADILWAADAAIVKWETVLEQVGQARNAFRSSFFGGEWGWKRSKLGDLFDVQLGKMLSPKARRGISPKPYLGNVNVQWGWFDLSYVKTMDFDEEEFGKFVLKPGDLLVCEGGEVGRSAIWMGQIEDCCYQKALHRLRPLNGQLMPEIMLQFMFYAAQHGLFARLTGHSTIAHLTAVKLRMLHVPVPPAEEQQRAIDAFEQFEWSIKSTEQHLERARDVKDKLLDSLLVPSRGSAI